MNQIFLCKHCDAIFNTNYKLGKHNCIIIFNKDGTKKFLRFDNNHSINGRKKIQIDVSDIGNEKIPPPIIKGRDDKIKFEF